MSDYGRIHLHFDTFPVSGTTTTLDSLAMGISVLTSPRRTTPEQYQRQFLSMLGLVIMFVQIRNLPSHARCTAERYRSVGARKGLAQRVRQSPVCNEKMMPRMFVEQLQQMLRQVSNTIKVPNDEFCQMLTPHSISKVCRLLGCPLFCCW